MHCHLGVAGQSVEPVLLEVSHMPVTVPTSAQAIIALLRPPRTSLAINDRAARQAGHDGADTGRAGRLARAVGQGPRTRAGKRRAVRHYRASAAQRAMQPPREWLAGNRCQGLSGPRQAAAPDHVAKVGGLLLRLAGCLVIEAGCRRLRIADRVADRQLHASPPFRGRLPRCSRSC